jgi:DNA-binding protein HU-beta
MAKKVTSKKKAATAKPAPAKPAKAPPPRMAKPVPAKKSAKTTGKPVGKKAAKAAAPATVTMKHLAAGVAAAHDLPAKQAEALVTGVFGRLVDHIKAGDRVRIVGLGIIEVKNRAARMGRNPATGEAIQIKASRKVAFRASKDLKEAI